MMFFTNLHMLVELLDLIGLVGAAQVQMLVVAVVHRDTQVPQLKHIIK